MSWESYVEFLREFSTTGAEPENFEQRSFLVAMRMYVRFRRRKKTKNHNKRHNEIAFADTIIGLEMKYAPLYPWE